MQRELLCETFNEYGLPDNENEAALLRARPLGFVHLPKTGGTTTSDWICEHVPSDRQFVCDNPTHFASVGRELAIEKRISFDFQVIRGHFHLKDGYEYAAAFRNTPRFFFTIVREPEAQLMSLLWHSVSQRRNLTTGRDHAKVRIDGFMDDYIAAAESFEFEGDGSQCGYFLANPHGPFVNGRKGENIERGIEVFKRQCLSRIDLVGLNERFVDSLRLLAWSMNWPAPRNVGNARFSGAGRSRLPEEIRAILWRRLTYDRALYEVAKERFSAAFDRLLASAGSADRIDDFLDSRAEREPLLTSRRSKQS